jgi:hypothetical protein
MKFTIPTPLQQEHEAPHDEQRRAIQAGGEVGEVANPLARLMHPHFVKEDQIALPPLGLLAALSRGEHLAGMAEALTPGRGAGRPSYAAVAGAARRPAGGNVTAMQSPAFFDQAPAIVVPDALAQTLGAVHDGLIE